VDTGEEDIIFQGVSLTGNVIGLESVVEGSFWERYPLVAIFFIAIAVLFIVVLVTKRNLISERG